MNTNEQTQLLDCLQSLLERQIELAQQANIGDVELLSEQTTYLVEKIQKSGLLESDEFENRLGQLRKLYEDLSLAIMDQKTDVSEKLNRVRKGMKTIETYRS
jgi:hypothetical protein